MSANTFKRLNVSDTFVVPYTANKSWDIDSSSFADNRIVINLGTKYTGTFDPSTEYVTNGQYDRLVYESANFTYYPTFLPRVVSTASLQNTIYNDGTLSTSSYWKGINVYNPGNLDTVKFFPTGVGDSIYVINIPKTLTGDKILPTTFELIFDSASIEYKIYDDGNYNLFFSGSNISSSINTLLSQSSYVGNVFYEQNVAILTVIPNAVRATGWRGINPYCLQVSLSPTPSISVTPSITPSITSTPSVTPSVTPSISVTPSNTATPSVTPSNTATPSVTPSNTVTPSVTPSNTVTPSVTPSVTLPNQLVEFYGKLGASPSADTATIFYSFNNSTWYPLTAGPATASIDDANCDSRGTISVASGTTVYVHLRDSSGITPIGFNAQSGTSCPANSNVYCDYAPFSVVVSGATDIALTAYVSGGGGLFIVC